MADTATQDSPLASAVRSVGHATDGVANSVEKAATNGLRGVLANNVGNLSAVAVICGLVVYQVRDTAANAREDRQMFREELKDLRVAKDSQTEKIVDRLDAVKTSIEYNTRTIERIGRDAKDEARKVGGGGTTKVGGVSFMGPIRELAPNPSPRADHYP